MAGFLKDWLGQNPFYQGLDDNRSAIGQFGLGLMTGTTPQEGLARGVAGAFDGRKQDTAYATEKKKEADRLKGINMTAEMLRSQAHSDPFAADMAGLVDAGAITPNDALSQLWKMRETGTSDWARLSDGQLFNQRTGETRAVSGGAAGQPNISTQPNWFKDPETGEMVLGQLADNGTMVRTDLGGLQPVTPFDLNSSRAAGTAFGKPQGADMYNLPDTIAQGEQAIQNLYSLIPEDEAGNPKANPGFEEEFGSTFMIPNSRMPVFDRTPRADFKASMDQVEGQAFLQGIAQMKGTGAISEAEGSKATQAIMRASTAQTKEAFVAAIKEAAGIVNAGLQRARQKAAAGTSAPTYPTAAPAASTGYSVLSVE